MQVFRPLFSIMAKIVQRKAHPLKYLFLLCLIAVSVTSATLAQEPEPSPALLQYIEGLESYTRSTRELDQPDPLIRLFPAREDAVSYVLGLYDAEFDEEEAERTSQFYIAFDFLPPETDYLSIYLELLGSQIGGFYEPETGQMNTILISGGQLGDALPLMEQIIYVHEYTHVLQDQNFDIVRIQGAMGENPDRVQAVLSLIEGDATLIMTAYTQSVAEKDPLGTGLQLLLQGALTGTLVLPPGIPDVITAELLSPYERGMDFVAALYEAGGWEQVNAAYENLPQSMEQILHPEKYLAGEGPVKVTLAEADLSDDWTKIWDITMGEFYLREYLKTQLPAREANRAAAGWGGDRVHIYRNENSRQLAWILQLEWDNAAEAAEFNNAYLTFGDQRFDSSADDDCWTGETDALCYLAIDADTSLLAYAPTLELAQQLALSQQ